MTGKYFFNEFDLYSTWGITISPGLYDEVLKAPQAKFGYTRDWPDQNGTERDTSTIFYQSKKLNIRLAITAPNKSTFFTRYNSFLSFLTSGEYFDFDILDINRRLKLIYENMSTLSKYGFFSSGEEIVCEFNLVLIDDFPTEINTIPMEEEE